MDDLTTVRALVFDAMDEQIAVIDQAGAIIDVNSAWINFGVENGISPDYSWVGCNYLEIIKCSLASGDSLAGEATGGIFDVLNGKEASFYCEYPCHSPEERRWFMMRMSPLTGTSKPMFVIAHYNITKRKLAEEQAEHLSRHDPLTGLANRRYFNEFLNGEMRRSIRDGSMIGLVLIDVDYFKDYNDELGHLAGDQCLIKVAQALQTFSRRPSDLAARLGGDEFALIMGHTDSAESQLIADAITRAIANLKLIFGGSRQVTVSVGVAVVIPNQQQTAEFLFQEADKALYRAKSAGRNQMAIVQTGYNDNEG